ncbi:hypothetical protein, partial [Rothia nasimurium]
MTMTTKWWPRRTTHQRTGSVRLRIVAWMVLVTTFVITGLIFTVREILISEVGTKAAANTSSEISEFRTFAELGVDPTTAAPFENLDQMLTTFVSRQYTGYSEQLIGVTPQQVIFIDEQQQFAEDTGYRLHQDRDLLASITGNSRTSGIEQTPAGPVHWGKVEISLNTDSGSQAGYLVVVEYIQPELDAVQHTI